MVHDLLYQQQVGGLGPTINMMLAGDLICRLQQQGVTETVTDTSRQVKMVTSISLMFMQSIFYSKKNFVIIWFSFQCNILVNCPSPNFYKM